MAETMTTLVLVLVLVSVLVSVFLLLVLVVSVLHGCWCWCYMIVGVGDGVGDSGTRSLHRYQVCLLWLRIVLYRLVDRLRVVLQSALQCPIFVACRKKRYHHRA